MRVAGVLEIDLSPAADEFGYFSGRNAARLVPQIPEGITVELRLGSAVPLDGLLGPLLAELRPAGSVVVRGNRAAAVAALYEALRIAYARAGVQ